jgi:hypothetical protein
MKECRTGSRELVPADIGRLAIFPMFVGSKPQAPRHVPADYAKWAKIAFWMSLSRLAVQD